MGYFSNGTEGMDYESRWCSRCVHLEGCAVWEAHLIHNYDERQDSILDVLIPRVKNGLGNAKCRMFHEDVRKDATQEPLHPLRPDNWEPELPIPAGAISRLRYVGDEP